MSRQAVPGDFGVGVGLLHRFDPTLLTITGCKCDDCWSWKTQLQNRRFWQLQSNKVSKP